MPKPKRGEVVEIEVLVSEIERARKNAEGIEAARVQLEQDNTRLRAHSCLKDKLSVAVGAFLCCATFSGASVALGKNGNIDLPFGGAALGAGALTLVFSRKAWNARPDCLPLPPEGRKNLERELAGRMKWHYGFLTLNFGENLLPLLTTTTEQLRGPQNG